jgi:hypothetical protein
VFIELVPTPTAHVAKYCCIECIEKFIHFIENLPTYTRAGTRFTVKEGAQQYLLEAISRGPEECEFSVDAKFRTISWCLQRGFSPSCEIFDNTFPYSAEQLGFLSSYSCLPYGFDLWRYSSMGLWREIRAIYDNLPDEDARGRSAFTKDMYKELLGSMLIPYEVRNALLTYSRLDEDCISVIILYL